MKGLRMEFIGREDEQRGVAAFHKRFLPEPYRHGEDLDFVRTTGGGIGDVMQRLTALGQELGFDVRTRMGVYLKVMWRFVFTAPERPSVPAPMAGGWEREPFGGTSKSKASDEDATGLAWFW